MTLMTASVRSERDAVVAADAGADIIHVSVSAGSGYAEAIRRVRHAVGTQTRLSASCMIAQDQSPTEVAERCAELFEAGVDFVRIVFGTRPDWEGIARTLSESRGGAGLIGIFPADAAIPQKAFDILSSLGFTGIGTDLPEGASGRLLDLMAPHAIAAFVEHARGAGLLSEIGGSLEAPDIPRLLAFAPDILSFGDTLAATGGGAAIDATAAGRIRALIPRSDAVATPASAPRPTLGTDRIFVRDFVLPVAVGAYGFERGRTQRVRFDVDTDVHRTTREPEDMTDVFSYDIIMDAIRAVVAVGHTDLVEALAERIAQRILQSPQVAKVTVRVEKLDLGPARAGVEIVREAGRIP